MTPLYKRYPLPKYVPDPRRAFAVNLTNYLDELGKALVAHKAPAGEDMSWFYGSYGLLNMESGDLGVDQPLGEIQNIIPNIWSDARNLTMVQLMRKADAILTHGVTVPLFRPERPFRIQTAEERLVNYFNGMRHLEMLRYTVGDSLFEEIVQRTDASGENGESLTDTLISQIATHTTAPLANAFLKALKTTDRTDPMLTAVRAKPGSVSLRLVQLGAWNFPVTLRFITAAGDTLIKRGVWPGANSRQFKTPGKVRSIMVDPDEALVEIHRYNNHWPMFPDLLRIQPFWGLPSWEYYKVIVSPVSWRDWNEIRRYGLRLRGGIGVDLMPLYPSDYRHRWMVEISAYGHADEPDKWGLRLNYGHPLSWPRRLFFDADLKLFHDYQHYEARFVKYIGESRYPFQGFQLQYQRLTSVLGWAYYGNQASWNKRVRVPYIRLNLTRFMLTESGYQLHYQAGIIQGWNGLHTTPFTLYRASMGVGGLLFRWLRAEFRGIGGYERGAVPYPFEFSQTRTWIHSAASLPGLQGQPTRDQPVNAYVGGRVSLGYWYKTFQPKIFASGVLYGAEQTPLNQAALGKAFGIGLEHQSFFFLGLYFPFWQSNPRPGEQQWALRYQWKFGLYL